MKAHLSAIALCASALLLTGCGAAGNRASSRIAQIRVVDATADAGTMDVYADRNSALLYNLNYGNVSTYIPLRPGSYNLSGNFAGTRNSLAQVTTPLQAGEQYTLLLEGSIGAPQAVLLPDRHTAAADGRTLIRYVHIAPLAGPVDIYLLEPQKSAVASTPLLANVQPGSAPTYISLPAGSYSSVVVRAGTLPPSNASTHRVSRAPYTSGSVHTVVLIDRPGQSRGNVDLLHLTDVDPSSD